MKITINNLSKIYKGKVQALDNVTIEISEGMFGLLGPNGAGKTTLMRILATLLEASSGDVKMGEYDITNNRKEIRKILGYLPQDFGVYPKMRTGEFLDYIALLSGIKEKSERKKRVEKMLDIMGLTDAKDRKTKKLSRGMIRRLGIAQALIGDPKILIVDEPTTGLDPEERIKFRNLLADISSNKVVILSTHIVADISSTCENMALLYNGRLAFNGSPTELVKMADGHVWRIIVDENKFDEVKVNYNIISMVPINGKLELKIVGKELKVYSGENLKPTLEDAYVYFMESQLGKKVSEEDLK
jgi:ABC-type multidrug transport system ATPase subunit